MLHSSVGEGGVIDRDLERYYRSVVKILDLRALNSTVRASKRGPINQMEKLLEGTQVRKYTAIERARTITQPSSRMIEN